MTEVAVKMSQREAWLLSTRPKTLCLSITPFIVGSVAAYVKQGSLNWVIFFCAILSAICIQIGTNLINDAYDAKHGTDTEKRLGPKRGVQAGVLTPQQVRLGGFFSFLLALGFGVPLVGAGGVPILLVLLASVICGFLYTGGPFPLAYKGLGEVFVIAFFGIVSTAAGYFLQTGIVDAALIVIGLQLGLLATLPIAINNLRDTEEDSRANKRTLAVRFGKTFARYEIAGCAVIPFVLGAFWVTTLHPLVFAGPLLTLPLAIKIVRGIWENEPGKVYNRYLGLSVLLHTLFGALICLSLFI